jgi:pimeloyl-ACP methyl ester carboxylesterase
MAGAVAAIDGPRALVGHSLGGAVALELARTRPDLVQGLVVIAGGARLPVPDRVMERAAADPDAERARLLDGLVADPGAAAARGLRAALQACGPAALAADYAACRDFDLRGSLAEIRVPVLVIAGAEDRLVPPWLGEELARGLPMARMVVVAGARHAPMADAPATVNLLLAAYLARLELTLAGA